MDKEILIPALRSVERELAPELSRAQRQELSTPPRQAPRAYAPPSYRLSDDEIDPVIKGLLTHLPVAGSVWPEEARKLWLELLAGSFRMIYREAEKQQVTAELADTGTTQSS